MKKKISVIVIAYNVEPYLDKCIQSVLSQSHQNLEVILVNDGSTDQGLEVFRKYEKRDDRIVVIDQENAGLLAARKAGLSVATGDFVAFVDGDDWVESDMYECLLRCAVDNDAQIVMSGLWRDNEDGSYAKWKAGTVDEGYYQEEKLENFKRSLIDNGYFRINGSICNKLFESRLLKKVYNELYKEPRKYGDDWVVLFPCVLDADGIVITHEAYYHGFERNNSITHSNHDDIYEYISKTFQILRRFFSKNAYGKELLGQLSSVFLNEFFTYLPQFMDISVSRYVFVNSDINGRIVLYGAGVVGQSYYDQFVQSISIEIALWVDMQKQGQVIKGETVVSPELIMTTEFDYIVIGVKDQDVAESIRRDLQTKGIDKEKILWQKPVTIGHYCYEKGAITVGQI